MEGRIPATQADALMARPLVVLHNYVCSISCVCCRQSALVFFVILRGRCALVGNSGILIHSHLGHAIDAHDVVMRLNQVCARCSDHSKQSNCTTASQRPGTGISMHDIEPPERQPVSARKSDSSTTQDPYQQPCVFKTYCEHSTQPTTVGPNET